MPLTSEQKVRIRRMIEQEVSYRRIAHVLGVTVGQVAGFLNYNYVTKGRPIPMKKPTTVEGRRLVSEFKIPDSWTEESLTEPWAKYHACKQQERKVA